MSQGESIEENQPDPPKWQPLSALERRIVGVLVEKAKTTPSAYPLTLSAICTAGSQKSNRYPIMQVEAENADDALERLRHIGAVAEVQGAGRVPKYRHYLYEWLGVDKTEMAVMAELILRGAQTIGELRGRAARMEPIAGMDALRPILQALQQRNLVVSLTPEGRGQIVTHGLYQPNELERIKAKHSGGAAPSAPASPAARASSDQPAAAPATSQNQTPTSPDALDELREEVREMRGELDQMKSAIEDLRSILR